jgi:hypothetical protein
MPDACLALTQWCNGDQTGVNPLLDLDSGPSGSLTFGATNGCNDPTSWAEAQDWTDNAEAPDCEGSLEALQTIDSVLKNAGVSQGLDLENLYCYQVEVFEDSPVGAVAACAELVNVNPPLLTAGDYLDFLTFLASLDPWITEDLPEECQVALDWAYWFGFTQQAIQTSATGCSEGGPTQVSNPVQFTNPELPPANNTLPQPTKVNGEGPCKPPPGTCTAGYEEWNEETCNCDEIN